MNQTFNDQEITFISPLMVGQRDNSCLVVGDP